MCDFASVHSAQWWHDTKSELGAVLVIVPNVDVGLNSAEAGAADNLLPTISALLDNTSVGPVVFVEASFGVGGSSAYEAAPALGRQAAGMQVTAAALEGGDNWSLVSIATHSLAASTETVFALWQPRLCAEVERTTAIFFDDLKFGGACGQLDSEGGPYPSWRPAAARAAMLRHKAPPPFVLQALVMVRLAAGGALFDAAAIEGHGRRRSSSNGREVAAVDTAIAVFKLVETRRNTVCTCCIRLDSYRVQAESLHSASDYGICKHLRAAAGCGSAEWHAGGARSSRLRPWRRSRSCPAGPTPRHSCQADETKVSPCPPRALPTVRVS
jgi:hypothetical protein